MLSWAIDYWYLCLIALIIGVATAAWIWLRVAPVQDNLPDIDEPVGKLSKVAAAPPPLEPIKPVIDVAEPVKFVAPAPEPVAVPVAPSGEAAARPAIAAAVGEPDDLSLIKGVGPKLKLLLTSLGVTRFDQIAAWGAADIAEIDQYLGTFKGRITRDSWVEQAGFLAKGDHAGFAAKFGAVGSENK
jgi:predicted flap endonuclease-1-like 5' DNA nuclease